MHRVRRCEIQVEDVEHKEQLDETDSELDVTFASLMSTCGLPITS